ncbi:MAG: (2Fe-2S)-binding protein, partial [Proteobacteria bacterium]|nr:(2Fe-2S)-binding protein [Pseudomonadota bacterium]
ALDGSDKQTVKCDTIVASSGRYPRHKLLGQSGAKMVFDPEFNFHLPEQLPAACQAAGRVLGLEDHEAIKAQGKMAAAKALKHLGIDAESIVQEAAAILDKAPAVKAVPRQAIVTNDKKKTFVCYCNDVTESDVEFALAEGFENIETVKRYTTATMGMCQGGMCEANFAHVLAEKKQELKPRVLPTPRPPATSISLSNMASGHHDYPLLTPLHHVQIEKGAKMTRLGDWVRAEDFGDPEAESLAIHNAAGICDVSTIGKFRVHGPDAEKLINRIITRNVATLHGNKIMYHAVCNEEGILIDDGIVLKVGEHDYFLTTLTGRAPLTEEWFARWSRDEKWQAGVVNVTETLAGMTVAGPKSREILAQLTDADISNTGLPFMNWAQIEMAGVKVRIMRMGFEGELCLELNCPSSQAAFLWNRILEVGKPSGLRPFGFEAMNICRLEKGHVVPGLDTDGFTNLFEASFGWLLDRSKTETVGKPMLDLLEAQEFKQQVIAFSINGRSPIKDGSLVVDGPRRFGHITVVRYSPLLDKTIGMALVEPNENWRKGGTVKIWLENREIEAGFVKPPFYDPNGERMKI